MLIIGIVLFILGFLMSVIGSVWGLVQAFSENVLWGLAYLFIPFAAVVFYLFNWGKKNVRNAFFLQILGLTIAIIGSWIFRPAVSNYLAANLEENITQIEQEAANPTFENPTYPTTEENMATENNNTTETPLAPIITQPQPASDPFREGINSATKAAELAQTSNTEQQWTQVALQWHKALTKMKEVPPSHPQYTAAQERVNTYRNNREIAKQRAASSY